jgi:hypothetical protein
LIICAETQQEFIKAVYARFPVTSATSSHRVHASVAIVGQLCQIAEAANTTVDFSGLTVQALNSACVNIMLKRSDWPDIFSSTDLSSLAAAEPLHFQWWLPDDGSDDGDDSTLSPILHC